MDHDNPTDRRSKTSSTEGVAGDFVEQAVFLGALSTGASFTPTPSPPTAHPQQPNRLVHVDTIPPTYPSTTYTNPFHHRTPHETLGFMPPSEAFTMNALEGTRIPSEAHQPFNHTAIFHLANRPLPPGQNLFQDLDPQHDRRRLHNIIGGWVANDGSSNPMATVFNPEMEPESWQTGRKKTHRGKRGGKVWKRRGGQRVRGKFTKTGKIGGREKEREREARDHGAFEDTDEFFGVVGGGYVEATVSDYVFNPEAEDFTPGCNSGSWKVEWQRDEHDEGGGGLGAAN